MSSRGEPQIREVPAFESRETRWSWTQGLHSGGERARFVEGIDTVLLFIKEDGCHHVMDRVGGLEEEFLWSGSSH